MKRKSEAVEEEEEVKEFKPKKPTKEKSFNNVSERVTASARVEKEDYDVSILNLDELEKVDVSYVVLPQEIQKSYDERSDDLGKKVYLVFAFFMY